MAPIKGCFAERHSLQISSAIVTTFLLPACTASSKVASALVHSITGTFPDCLASAVPIPGSGWILEMAVWVDSLDFIDLRPARELLD